MVGFDKNSSTAKVNKALKSKYGFTLKNVENSLREIKAIFSLTNMERNIPNLEREIRQLSSINKRLVKMLDDFMKSSKGWEKLQLKLQHKTPWTEQEKMLFIKKEFRLESFFEGIGRKVSHLKKNVLLFRNLKMRIAGEKKLIHPHTIAILVWMIATQQGHDTHSEKFETVRTLLEWLSEHRRTLLMETIGQERKYLTSGAIRRDYERYVSKPSKKTEVYFELAFSIYCESFSDIEH